MGLGFLVARLSSREEALEYYSEVLRSGKIKGGGDSDNSDLSRGAEMKYCHVQVGRDLSNW